MKSTSTIAFGSPTRSHITVRSVTKVLLPMGCGIVVGAVSYLGLLLVALITAA